MSGKALSIDAELHMSVGIVKIIRQSWQAPYDRCGVTPRHHLELSLLPRSMDARTNYPAHWGKLRFEPIGEMFLFPGGELMHAKSDCQHQNSIVLEFDAASVAQWVDFAPAWTGRQLQACLNIVNHDLRSLLFRIGEEARAPGLAGRTMIELMAAQTVIELTRYISGVDEEKSMGGLAPWRLRLIDERLIGNIVPPSVGELAALCNISVRHLTRAFRVSRGRSLGKLRARTPDYPCEKTDRIRHAGKIRGQGDGFYRLVEFYRRLPPCHGRDAARIQAACEPEYPAPAAACSLMTERPER